MPQVKNTQVKSPMSHVLAHGSMGGKAATKGAHAEKGGTVKDGAYGGGCQKLTDTHSCLQLPEHRSFSKMPAGILKLKAALRLTRTVCTSAQAHTLKAENIYIYIIVKRG